MAKSWADMSKEERDASGQTKKEYNRSTGQSTIPKYNPAPTPTPAPAPTPTPTPTPSSSTSSSTSSSGSSVDLLAHKKAKEDAEAAKVQAKEKASAYLRDHPNAGKSTVRDDGYYEILKEGGLTNDSYQKMVKQDQKVAYEQNQIEKDKEREAYNQSRLDLQAHKAEFGPKNVYGMQSARDTHERSMARGNPKVTGPQANDSADMLAANELAKELYDSGYDYSHNEMVRHRNGGADVSKTNSYLYDAYGGYQNWYDNHSLFNDNFTGSKDLMDFDEVMEIGQRQQDELKNYKTSDEYMSKYGQYDWAKDFNEKYGQGAN